MKFAGFMVALFLAGCATVPKQDIESMQAIFRERQIASAAVFEGVSEQQIFDAAIQVFNQLDGKDFEYDIRSNQLLAARQWSEYLVFASTWAKDFWELKARRIDGNIHVTVAAITVSDTGILSGPVSERFRSDIQISGRNDIGLTVNDYRLFYDRINYFLGKTQDWPVCKEYEQGQMQRFFMCKKHVKDNAPKAWR